ncbi:MAG: 3'-5' exonuclease [Blautia massiliensis (ex Durand et al. 2017)]|uniref:3'-5' exonuclease n=1 Tax=Blautia massiliensis (ex Durand et al. 2017) TaxID=1737424 RepID=UPI00399CC5A4
MVGTEKVLDKETGEYRPLRYGDIVILLRSATGWAETFGEVLSSRGIPVYTASRTGYFSTTEVVTLLNYLRILDNPLQDIPLTGVLRSPMAGCTTEELAEIRIACPEGMIYECVKSFVEDYREHKIVGEKKKILGEKLSCFMENMNALRDMSAYTPVHQLILEALERTGYGRLCKSYAGWCTEEART